MKVNPFAVFFNESMCPYLVFKTVRNEQNDLDFEVISANQIFQSLSGLEQAIVLNKKLSELMACYKFEHGERIMEAFRQALATNNNVNMDVHMINTAIWYRISIFPLKDDCVLCAMANVTKTYEYEQQIACFPAKDVAHKVEEDTGLREQAMRDELTNAYNRYYLDEILNKGLKKNRDGICIAIMDLDNFKRINDIWGHPMGDEVLIHVTRVVQEKLRKSDVMIRFGGEEFLILLRYTSLQGAFAAAEKARIALEQQAHPVTGAQTASFGVAQWTETEDFHNCYRRADKALYKAKQMGKNCVVVCDDTIDLMATLDNLIWKPQWDSGNLEIDAQHQKLVKQVKELIELFLTDQITTKQQELLFKQFKEEMQSHIAVEEKVMKQVCFPEIENHMQLHRALLKNCCEIMRQYETGEIKFTDVATFMVDELLIGHLLKVDSKYFPYIK